MSENLYYVYGMTQSYFTRKITGYLDYKKIPWRLCRFTGNNPEVLRAGWTDGIPAVKTPEGEFMWDSTPVIHHRHGHAIGLARHRDGRLPTRFGGLSRVQQQVEEDLLKRGGIPQSRGRVARVGPFELDAPVLELGLGRAQCGVDDRREIQSSTLDLPASGDGERAGDRAVQALD